MTMEFSTLKECPDCKGKGGGEGFMCGPASSVYGFISCGLCKGQKTVTAEVAACYGLGMVLRRLRQERNLGQIECGKRYGLKTAP
jgi:DnaJ-class molecular chaperone